MERVVSKGGKKKDDKVAEKESMKAAVYLGEYWATLVNNKNTSYRLNRCFRGKDLIR